jgi:hypothetical protein
MTAKGLKLNIYFISFILLLLACQEPVVEQPPTEYSIDKAFTKYVEKFFQEAQAAGVSIEKTNLIVAFGTTENKACGQCNYTASKPKIQRKVIINTDLRCWANLIETQKETLIFHELGHCLLKRQHRNEVFTDGSPKSIMVADNLDLYTACVYPIDGDNSCNKTFRRPYYVAELFNTNSPAPPWVKN